VSLLKKGGGLRGGGKKHQRRKKEARRNSELSGNREGCTWGGELREGVLERGVEGIQGKHGGRGDPGGGRMGKKRTKA